MPPPWMPPALSNWRPLTVRMPSAWPTRLARLKSASWADLAAVDLSGLQHRPCTIPVSHIVYTKVGHQSLPCLGRGQAAGRPWPTTVDIDAIKHRLQWLQHLDRGQNFRRINPVNRTIINVTNQLSTAVMTAYGQCRLSEVAKFERLADRWWDRRGRFQAAAQYQPAAPTTSMNATGVAEKQLLDVGCGGGILCEAMAQRGAAVTGIDMAEKPLGSREAAPVWRAVSTSTTSSSAPRASPNSMRRRSTSSPAWRCSEHVPAAATIRACARIDPTRRMCFSRLSIAISRFLFAIVGAEYILQLLPKGTHEYKKFIRPSELARWLRGGLELVDVRVYRNDLLPHQSFACTNGMWR